MSTKEATVFVVDDDASVRRALGRYARAALANPRRLFDRIMVQTISLQQPNEVLNGEANLCDGCLNMMIYNGKLIRSCRLDEYRMFGAPVIPMLRTITGDFSALDQSTWNNLSKTFT